MSGECENGTPDILLKIASDRAKRVCRKGAAQGLKLPEERMVPLVNFGISNVDYPEKWQHRFGSPGKSQGHFTLPDPASNGILIAEIKRCSPSKGNIANIPDPAVLAGRYKEAGFQRVSVLTEEIRFGGSLSDLIAVKTAHPDLSILRKDFLLSVDDIEVSWRAGADAILLIATLLDQDVFEMMYNRATALGIACLVEVHTFADVNKVRPFQPPLVGINSRNLRRFTLEPLLPLEIRRFIDWPCDVIYESGITSTDDVLFVRGAGFSGFLVGEAVTKSPVLADRLVRVWGDVHEAHRRYSAWGRLYNQPVGDVPLSPLVKICGITNRNDAKAAVDAGADIIGFVLAESPRRTSPEVVRECTDLPIMKVGVVALDRGEKLPLEIASLLEEGALDFIQFHGNESPEMVKKWPGYKALQLASVEDAETIAHRGSPAVLVDAFSPVVKGGTGRRLDEVLVSAAARQRRLWLAGGLTAENIDSIIHVWKPGLVDVSSGVERAMGLKDYDALRRFVTVAKKCIPNGTPGDRWRHLSLDLESHHGEKK